jgi:hypothetical protein
MFTARHYRAIALVLQDAWWQVIRDRLADLFARDNSRFGRTRFLEACEPLANVHAKVSNAPPRDLIWPRAWQNVGTERSPQWDA